jgi:hypothetical protein
LDGKEALSLKIKPVGYVNYVVVGAAVTAGNNAADIMRTLEGLNFIQEDNVKFVDD